MPWIYVAALLLIIGGILLWLKYSGILYYFSSYEALEAYLNSAESGGPLIYFVLQVLQVIIAPVPGNITTLAGSAVFGFWKGFFLSFAGVLAGSSVGFLMGRVCGRPLVSLFAKEATIDKYLVTFASKQQFMLLVFFILPFFPDDVLCILAGITSIGWPFFLIASVLGRPWGLMVSAFIGSGALSMPIWVYVVGAIAGVALLVIAFRYGPKLNERVIAWATERAHRRKHHEH